MVDKGIKANLVFIKANCGNIPSCLTRIETSGISLAEAIGIVNNAKACILNNTGNQGKAIKKKLEMILQKNYGYIIMELNSSLQ